MAAIKVGYLGSDASTFGYMAMRQYFQKIGLDIEPKGFGSHAEICEKVGRNHIDFGVVAIENVLDGVVTETARTIEKIDNQLGLAIQGEVLLPIKLYAASKTGSYDDIKKLISHRSALGQCSLFVSRLEARGIVTDVRSSTGVAAQEASSNPEVAALASLDAVNECGLLLIEPDSVTNHGNSATRFWILGKKHAERTGNDKTCFLVNLEQAQFGALHKTFGVFAQEKINILLIYPIPIFGKMWEYTFLVEVQGHIDDDSITNAWH